VVSNKTGTSAERCNVRVCAHAYAFTTVPASRTDCRSHAVLHAGTRPAFLAALPRTLALPLKALFQALALLLMMLLWLPAPDALLLQVLQGSHTQWASLNPPAVSTRSLRRHSLCRLGSSPDHCSSGVPAESASGEQRRALLCRRPARC